MDQIERWRAEHVIASRFVAALEAGHDHVAVTVSEVKAAFGDGGDAKGAFDRLGVPWSMHKSHEENEEYVFQQENTTERALLAAGRWRVRVAERLRHYLAQSSVRPLPRTYSPPP